MSKDKLSKIAKKIQEDINVLENYLKKSGNIPDNNYAQRFIKICDNISNRIRSLTLEEKKHLYSMLTNVRLNESRDFSKFDDIIRHKGFKLSLKKSHNFLIKYKNLSDIEILKIEDCREIMQIISREQDLSKITVSTNNKVTNGKSISQLYDEAFVLKTRGKKEEAKTCLNQIKKFIDKEAFRHYVAANYSCRFYSFVSENDFKTKNEDEVRDILNKQMHKINEMLDNTQTLACYTTRLFLKKFDRRINYFKAHKKFVFNIFKENYTQELCDTHNSLTSNPFNVISLAYATSIAELGSYHHSGLMVDRKHLQEFNRKRKAPSSAINANITLDLKKIPSIDEKKFLELYPESSYFLYSWGLDLLNRFMDDNTAIFKRSSSPQEKPIIADHPDHPEKEKPVVAAHPDHPEKSKPKITDHGENPETSLKEQVPDRSKEQEDIMNIYSLPPSEAMEDKTLSETLLAYGFIKGFPVLKKNTISFLSKSLTSFERFFSSYLPKFSLTYNAPSRGMSKKANGSTRYFMSENGSQDSVLSNKNGSSDVKSKPKADVKKNNLAAKSGFILTGVVIGLEVLHARLVNAGYKRAASFVPVSKYYRPWGEAYFSTVDYNLGVDPAAGYSTTRLFTHAADATSYVVEGIGNIIYTAGKAERFIYKSILNEKITGFDAGHLGIINGVGDAIGTFVDSMGGSLEIRRAKAQAEFTSNISGYEAPNQKKTRVSKPCIDRGLSHLLKEKTPVERVKKVSGTYAKTKHKVAQSLLHDYSSSEKGDSALNIKTAHLNKDPFKARNIMKPNNCLKKYVKKPAFGTASVSERRVPIFNKSALKTDTMITQR